MIKKTLPLLLALCLLLSACGGKTAGGQKTPEELSAAYAQAITDARDQELNDAFPLIDPADEMFEPVLGMMGLTKEDLTASAVAVSMRGIQAYSIVAVMPAQDKADGVREALEGYIEQQKNNFQFYLEDQYEIASQARLDTLADGTVLLVMCDGQDAVFDRIRASLEG